MIQFETFNLKSTYKDKITMGAPVLYEIYGEEGSQNGTIEDGGIPYLLDHYWVWAMKIKIRHIWRRHAFSNQAIWVGALGTQSEN